MCHPKADQELRVQLYCLISAYHLEANSRLPLRKNKWKKDKTLDPTHRSLNTVDIQSALLPPSSPSHTTPVTSVKHCLNESLRCLLMAASSKLTAQPLPKQSRPVDLLTAASYRYATYP